MAAIQHAITPWQQRELTNYKLAHQSKSFDLKESRRISLEKLENEDFFQLNQYKLTETIGQGSYGVVKLGYNIEDEKNYAIKILNKKKLMKKNGIFARLPPKKKMENFSENPLRKIYSEVAILKKLNHRNVVKLVEILDDPSENFLYLAFEFCEHGQILEIPTLEPLAENLARKYFRDVILGLEYLHFQRIIHRDLKPANLLLSKDGRVRIADLGVCTEFEEGSDAILVGNYGTPAFAPPETVGGEKYFSGKPADIWSLGITLYSLVIGNVPFYHENPVILYRKILEDEVKFTRKISDSLRNLIEKMLIKNPKLRIKLPEIKTDFWVTDGDKLPELPVQTELLLPVKITEDDVKNSIVEIPKLDTLILIKHMLKKHSFQNPFSQKNEDAQRRNLFKKGRANSAN